MSNKPWRNMDFSGFENADFSNPLVLVLALPMIVIAIVGGIIDFIQQPTAAKVAQIGFGCIYLILAIVLSPCACAIWIIQAIAS